MKKLFPILFVSLFIFSCDSDNLIEEVKERYDGGDLKVVEYYKQIDDNLELVKKVEFYNNGETKKRHYYTYTNEVDEIISYITYFDNGEVSSTGKYKNGRSNIKESWLSNFKPCS